jgi:hypothetical protein
MTPTIKKVKLEEDGRVTVSFFEKRKLDEREVIFRTHDKPHADLLAALQAIHEGVRQILALFLPWCKDKLVVTGVSWSQSEGTGVEGACIVASVGLETCNAPLNLVTPHLPFDQYSEGAEQPVMPQSGQEALEILRKETMLFLDGSKRAQSTFDFREAA